MFNRKEYDRLYRIKNKIKREIQGKQWRENNPEYSKQYRQRNKERILGNNRLYRQKNKEQIKEYSRKWLKTDMGKAYNQRKEVIRQTREREIINTLTSQEWIDILKEYHFRCAYCGCEFTLFNKETRDHVIPISKGGDNIKENIVPACQSCNSKKWNKII